MDFLTTISLSLSKGECPQLEYTKEFDQYMDQLLADGLLIKHDTYSFSGKGWAEKINENLIQMNSPYRLIAVYSSDNRLYTVVKGQAIYFLVTNNDQIANVMILTFSDKPFVFVDKR